MKTPKIHTLAVGIGLGALAFSSFAAAKPIPVNHSDSFQSQVQDDGPRCGDEDDEEKKKKKS
ncbi:MAG: hypothetical protein KC766_31780 [Myxococcales bacterium]|nr:hypothetical protein [Myxococcales bacterium]